MNEKKLTRDTKEVMSAILFLAEGEVNIEEAIKMANQDYRRILHVATVKGERG